MSRYLKYFLAFALIFITLINASGCIFLYSDEKVAEKKAEQLFLAMESKDKEAIIELLSEVTINQALELDAQIDALFDYFDGEIVSYYDFCGGPYVSTSQENGLMTQYMESTYELKTTSCDYRICFGFTTIDDINEDNIGIKFIYIIKAADDPTPDYAYRGDGKMTSGIHIGLIYEFDYDEDDVNL